MLNSGGLSFLYLWNCNIDGGKNLEGRFFCKLAVHSSCLVWLVVCDAIVRAFLPEGVEQGGGRFCVVNIVSRAG